MERHLERRPVIARLVWMTGHRCVRHLFGTDEVAPPHVRRILAEAHGDQIHQALVRQHRRHHAHAPIRALGRAVGRNRDRVVLVVADVIGPGDQAGARHGVEGRAVRPRPVRADTRQDPRAQSEHAPVTADGRAEGDLLVTRMAGSLHVLRAVLDPFHRRGEAAGDPRQQDVLRVDADLLPESAAHVRRDHAHLAPQAFRYRIGDQMRRLGGCIDHAVRRRDHTPTFHRHRGHARMHDLTFDDDVGRRKSLIEVAVCTVHRDVAVAGHAVVDERRALRHGGSQRAHRRQRIQVNGDQLRRILGLVAAPRHDRRDRLADEAHAVDGEDGPVG